MDGSMLGMVLRLVTSLAVVLGLMYGITAFLRRKGIGGFAPTKAKRSVEGADVEVLARKPLGRNASIAIVRAGAKSMVLGITETSVTMLTEADVRVIDLEEMEDQRTVLPRAALNGASPPWKTMLEGLRDRTARRV
jgi:flagellar biogenesis protein FliO